MNIIKTNLQFNSNYSKRSLDSIKEIILHNSGVTVLQSVEVIHNYHKNTRGWAGIGYHFYVRKDGSIYEGRPIDWAGAHATGHNSNSIGICAEGNFDVETMSEVQKNAIKELIAYLKEKYNITIIKGHREVNNTSCPGANYPLDEMKNTEVKPVVVSGYTYENFVKDVQIAEGQTGKWIDGIAGSKTLNLTPTVSEKINRNHKIVTALERYLKELGYYTGEIEEDYGKTPIFGGGMTSAVKAYQRDNGCVVDGEITARNKTWKKLLKIA